MKLKVILSNTTFTLIYQIIMNIKILKKLQRIMQKKRQGGKKNVVKKQITS